MAPAMSRGRGARNPDEKSKTISPKVKLVAIQKVKSGQSKAAVAREMKVPESTLRGWCKNEGKIVQLAKQADEQVAMNGSMRVSPGSNSGSISASPLTSSDESSRPHSQPNLELPSGLAPMSQIVTNHYPPIESTEPLDFSLPLVQQPPPAHRKPSPRRDSPPQQLMTDINLAVVASRFNRTNNNRLELKKLGMSYGLNNEHSFGGLATQYATNLLLNAAAHGCNASSALSNGMTAFNNNAYYPSTPVEFMVEGLKYFHKYNPDCFPLTTGNTVKSARAASGGIAKKHSKSRKTPSPSAQQHASPSAQQHASPSAQQHADAQPVEKTSSQKLPSPHDYQHPTGQAAISQSSSPALETPEVQPASSPPTSLPSPNLPSNQPVDPPVQEPMEVSPAPRPRNRLDDIFNRQEPHQLPEAEPENRTPIPDDVGLNHISKAIEYLHHDYKGPHFTATQVQSLRKSLMNSMEPGKDKK